MTDPTPAAPEKDTSNPATQPVQEALQQALREIDSPEKADTVIEELAATAAGQSTQEVAQTQPPAPTPSEVAQQVKQAEENAVSGEKAQTVLTETARVLTTKPSAGRETVAQAAQEVFNPQQQGIPAAENEAEREYLRQAVFKRLKFFDALDARLFLKINHLPHTPRFNRFFAFITRIFTGGAAWYALMGLIFLDNPPRGWSIPY